MAVRDFECRQILTDPELDLELEWVHLFLAVELWDLRTNICVSGFGIALKVFEIAYFLMSTLPMFHLPMFHFRYTLDTSQHFTLYAVLDIF